MASKCEEGRERVVKGGRGGSRRALILGQRGLVAGGLGDAEGV